MQQQLGKYKLIEQVGAGKFGVVFSAQDPAIGRLVAVKILKPEGFASIKDRQIAVKRFGTEIRAVGRLSHPNICTIHDSGLTDEGLPYLVMQLIDGKPLDIVLRDLGGAMEPFRVLSILTQLAAALDYAHSNNVIHRDLKPSNILLEKNDKPFIVDFSTAFLPDESLMTPDSVAGTPQYMAPEVIQGEKPTGAADLYSLGILAYVLFTGSRPFRDGDIRSTLEAIVRQSAFSFTELGCPLGARLERVLRRCLSKDPQDRFASAEIFVEACAEALKHKDIKSFSQVAPNESISSDPSSSIFFKSKEQFANKYRTSSTQALKLLLKLVLYALILIGLAMSIIILTTERISPTYQHLVSVFNQELKPQEISIFGDKSISLLLNSGMPESVKIAALAELKERQTPPFQDLLATLASDYSPEVRLQALALLAKSSATDSRIVEQNLLFGLSDPDRFIRLFSFSKLSESVDSKIIESLVKRVEVEADPMVKEINLQILQSKLALIESEDADTKLAK
jgi:serine/threonine protein kinase